LIPDEHRAGIDHSYAADIAFGKLDGQRQGVRIYPSHPYRRCCAPLRAALAYARFTSFDHDPAWVSAYGGQVKTA
jgi:hypothetical protein